MSAAWGGTVNATWYETEIAAGHTGNSGNPLLIYDEMSLAALANEANTNHTQDGFAGKHILLKTNLNLNGTVHLRTPIGNTTQYFPSPSTQIFKGTFDGNNKTISSTNVTVISTSNGVYAGLFGYVKDATIQNVDVVNASVTVTSSSATPRVYSGGLAGYVEDSTITNCYATGVVTAKSSIPLTSFILNICSGGLVGLTTKGNIMNSVALNQWVNASGGSGTINTGRFIGLDESAMFNPLSKLCYAWRYMELNINGTIVRPVPAGGNNATNVSTEMIWDNQPFYEQTLVGHLGPAATGH